MFIKNGSIKNFKSRLSQLLFYLLLFTLPLYNQNLYDSPTTNPKSKVLPLPAGGLLSKFI